MGPEPQEQNLYPELEGGGVGLGPISNSNFSAEFSKKAHQAQGRKATYSRTQISNNSGGDTEKYLPSTFLKILMISACSFFFFFFFFFLFFPRWESPSPLLYWIWCLDFLLVETYCPFPAQ